MSVQESVVGITPARTKEAAGQATGPSGATGASSRTSRVVPDSATATGTRTTRRGSPKKTTTGRFAWSWRPRRQPWRPCGTAFCPTWTRRDPLTAELMLGGATWHLACSSDSWRPRLRSTLDRSAAPLTGKSISLIPVTSRLAMKGATARDLKLTLADTRLAVTKLYPAV